MYVLYILVLWNYYVNIYVYEYYLFFGIKNYVKCDNVKLCIWILFIFCEVGFVVF